MLILMQGWPGSGKSTRAKQLAVEHNAVIYSTDEFFMVENVYKFDGTKLFPYHARNQERTKKALKEGKTVIVDNTNIKKDHVRPYLQAAKEIGCRVLVCRCTGNFVSVHDVPKNKVEAMKQEMEDLGQEMLP